VEDIDTIVTDGSGSGELVGGLRARGIEIIVASAA
jgi:hypothetical protein